MFIGAYYTAPLLLCTILVLPVFKGGKCNAIPSIVYQRPGKARGLLRSPDGTFKNFETRKRTKGLRVSCPADRVHGSKFIVVAFFPGGSLPDLQFIVRFSLLTADACLITDIMVVTGKVVQRLQAVHAAVPGAAADTLVFVKGEIQDVPAVVIALAELC